MRCLNLVPWDVLEQRRRRAVLRRSLQLLLVWAAILGGGMRALHREHGHAARELRDLETRVESALRESTRLDPLHRELDELRQQMAALAQLQGRRPVTGLVALLAARLPPRVYLEHLEIAATAAVPGARPGQTGYFAAGTAVPTLELRLRGAGRKPDDVAELLRSLQDCGRFRDVQLSRIDDQPQGGVRFEVRCGL